MPLEEKELPSLDDLFEGGNKAFFIGNSVYHDERINKLVSPENDIVALQHILETCHGFTVEEIITDAVTNERLPNPLLNAGKEQVLKFLSGIECEEASRVIIYFACHGVAEKTSATGNPEGFLLASDAQVGDHSTYIEMTLVHEILCKLPCRHLLIILDCCYAGAFRWVEIKRSLGSERPADIYYQKFTQFIRNKATQVITSAAADQQAVDFSSANRDDGKPTSPFARALCEALETGNADYINPTAKHGDGIITATELGLYLRDNFQQLKQIPAVWSIGVENKGEFIFLNPLIQQRKLLLLDPNRPNPYKGLVAYNRFERNVFFGRQRALYGFTDENSSYPGLIDIVQENAVVLVSGRSGLGKSSLVKAGVLSTYAEEIVHEIKPGRLPVTDNLALLNKVASETLVQQIIMVDQYEELITTCQSATERIDFEKKLSRISRFHKLIVTLRSDFEIQFKGSPLIGDGAGFFRFAVPVFSRDDFREIVTGPANLQALEYRGIVHEAMEQAKADTAFIERIVDDAYSYPDSLPLLSMALKRLFEQKESDEGGNVEYLTEEAYNQFNGIKGIIEEQAELVFQQLGNLQDGNNPSKSTNWAGYSFRQKLMLQLLFRMMAFEGNEVTKRRLYLHYQSHNLWLNEAAFTDSQVTDQARKVIDMMVEARLLKADTDGENNTYVEPAHEALLRSWPRLNTNLYEKTPANNNLSNHEKTVLLRQVSELAREYYFATPREKHNLLWIKDYRLQQVLLYKKGDWILNGVEDVFIEKSRRAKRTNKYLRNGAMATVLLALVVALYIFKSKNAAIQDQLGQNLWDQSLANIANNEKLLSLLYVTEALTTAADNNLRSEMMMSATAMLPHVILDNIIAVDETPYQAWDVSGDAGKVVVEAANSYRIVDAKTGTILHKAARDQYDNIQFCETAGRLLAASGKKAFLLDTTFKAISSCIAPDTINLQGCSETGNKIFTAHENRVSVWANHQNKLLPERSMECSYFIEKAVFSSNGERLLTSGYSNENHGTFDIWELSSGKSVYHYTYLNSFSTNKALDRFVLTEDDSSTRFIDLKSAYHLRYFRKWPITDSHFLGNDTVIVSDENGIACYDFFTGDKISPQLPNHHFYPSSLTVSKNNKYFLTTYLFEGKFYLYDIVKFAQVGEVACMNGSDVALSNDGRAITISGDKDIRIFRYSASSDKLTSGGQMLSLFSTDDTSALTYSFDGILNIWDLRSGLPRFPDKTINDLVDDSSESLDSSVYFTSKGGVLTVRKKRLRLTDLSSGFDESFAGTIVCNPFNAAGTAVCYASNGNTHIRLAPKWKDSIISTIADTVSSCFFIGDKNNMIYQTSDSRVLLHNQNTNTQILKAGKQDNDLIVDKFGNWCMFYNRNIKEGYIYYAGTSGNGTLKKVRNLEPDFTLSRTGLLVANIRNDSLLLYNTVTQKETYLGDGSTIIPSDISFSNNDSLCLPADLTWDFRVFSSSSGKAKGHRLVDSSSLNMYTISPQGKYIVAYNAEKPGYLFDYNKGKIFLNMEHPFFEVRVADNDEAFYGVDANDGTIYRYGYDADLPAGLFAKQVAVFSGVQLNLKLGELENVNSKDWLRLKKAYEKKAKNHLEHCNSKGFNTWANMQYRTTNVAKAK